MRAKQQLFSDFEKWGLDTRGWARLTRAKYGGVVRQADRWMLEHRGTSILHARPKDYEAYLYALQITTKARNAQRQALIAWGAYLTDIEWTETNPAAGLPRLREPEALPRPIPAEVVPRIEPAAKVLGPEIYALVCLLNRTGMRNSEARTLEWPMIDFSEADTWVRFWAKGSRERSLWVHPVAARALRRWKALCPDSRWVFPSPREALDQPIGPKAIGRWIHEVGSLAGFPQLTPHHFRHTVGSTLAAQGEHIRTVQEVLGHKSIKTTAIYMQVRSGQVKTALGRLHSRQGSD